jgi:hypothetical protein
MFASCSFFTVELDIAYPFAVADLGPGTFHGIVFQKTKMQSVAVISV